MIKNNSGSTFDLYDKTGVTQITFSGTGTGSQYCSRAISVNDAVDWDVGDSFSIGYEDITTAGDSYLYTIGDFTADKKTFSGSNGNGRRSYYNSNRNFIGAPVVNVTKRGVKISSIDGISAGLALVTPGMHFKIDGLSNSYMNHPTQSFAARLYISTAHDCFDTNSTTIPEISNSVFSTGNTSGLASSTIIQPKGLYIHNCYFVEAYSIYTIVANVYTRNGKNLSSGIIKYYDNLHIHNSMLNYASSGSALSIPWDVRRFTVYNQIFSMTRSGVGSTWIDCVVYASQGQGSPNSGESGGIWLYKNCINSIATNDYIDRINTTTGNNYAYSVNPGSVIVNNRIVSPKFDTIYTYTAGTYHFNFGDFQYSKEFMIENTNINPIINQSLQENIIEGSMVTFINWNSVTNDDRNYFKYGQIVRTGTSLGDTTAHNSGFAMRFQPNSGTSSLTYSMKIPVGNIQNKTAGVGVWCKIANSNYWSGNYQLPRLYLTYDNGTTVYVETIKTAGDWQFIHIPFTPTTTYGEIIVTFDVRSDATTSDSYVYFDDFSTFFPAGSTLNLGTFDLWALGMPVGPYISTTIAAQDVWAVPPTSFGTGTVGAKINTIEIKVDDSITIGRMG